MLPEQNETHYAARASCAAGELGIYFSRRFDLPLHLYACSGKRLMRSIPVAKLDPAGECPKTGMAG